MKPTTAYLIGGVIAVVMVVAGIYYLIPSSTPHFLGKANVSDTKHALVLFAVAIIALIGARFAANSKSA